MTIGLPPDDARQIAVVLSSQFGHLCRCVEIGAGGVDDFKGDNDEAHGGRVFRHHYCVHLAGPNHDSASPDFPADARAARGFNGDIAQQAQKWRDAAGHDEPAMLGRRIARKTLLALAGLVSIQDQTWSTDREYAARRWSHVEPHRAEDLARLLAWNEGLTPPSRTQVTDKLDDTVDPIVVMFAEQIGLWDGSDGP